MENVTNTVIQLFNEITVFPRPRILATSRVGTLKVDGRSKVRPIKVTFASPEAVKLVLRTETGKSCSWQVDNSTQTEDK